MTRHEKPRPPFIPVKFSATVMHTILDALPKVLHAAIAVPFYLSLMWLGVEFLGMVMASLSDKPFILKGDELENTRIASLVAIIAGFILFIVHCESKSDAKKKPH